MSAGARTIAASGVLALLCACSSTRIADRSNASASAPAGAPASAPAIVSATPPQTDLPSDLPGDVPPSPAPQAGAPPPGVPLAGDQRSPSDQRPPDAAPAVPACLPAQPVSKPKHRKRRSTALAKGSPPPEAKTVAETPPGAPINAEVGQLGSPVVSILGKKVQGPKGEDLGRVVDVLADASGQVRVAVIDFGGFLGVGTRRIAVDWPLLRFDPGAGDKPLILSLSREKLQSAPEYKDATRPKVLMPPAAAPPDAANAAETKK